MRRRLGFGALALLPVACCIGLPLLVAAGLGVVALAEIGGAAMGGVALVAAIALLLGRSRRAPTAACRTSRQGHARIP